MRYPAAGDAIGIACINTWLNDRTNLHWLRLSESLTAGRPELAGWLARVSAHMGKMDGDPVEAGRRAAAALARIVRREASAMAFADVLAFMSLLFFASLFLVPLLRRERRGGGAGALDESRGALEDGPERVEE